MNLSPSLIWRNGEQLDPLKRALYRDRLETPGICAAFMQTGPRMSFPLSLVGSWVFSAMLSDLLPHFSGLKTMFTHRLFLLVTSKNCLCYVSHSWMILAILLNGQFVLSSLEQYQGHGLAVRLFLCYLSLLLLDNIKQIHIYSPSL
jgi:hypothetical protein